MPISTFLNGSTPLRLRGAAWLALSETGMIGAGSIVDDAGGGGITVWTFGGTIPCRVDPLAGNERLVASRLSDESTHLLTVPPNTAVTTASRFAVQGGGTFEITAVRESTGEMLRVFEAVEVS